MKNNCFSVEWCSISLRSNLNLLCIGSCCSHFIVLLLVLGGVCGFKPLAVKHSHVSYRWVTHGIFNLRSILGCMLCTWRQLRRDEAVRLLAQKTGKHPRSCLNWDLNPYRWVFGTLCVKQQTTLPIRM